MAPASSASHLETVDAPHAYLPEKNNGKTLSNTVNVKTCPRNAKSQADAWLFFGNRKISRLLQQYLMTHLGDPPAQHKPWALCHQHGNHISKYECSRRDDPGNVDQGC